MTQTLLTLKEEQEGRVGSITHPDDDMRRRLVDLGFYQGTFVKKVLVSPKGDPIAYRVRGTTIALRNCDAQYIQLESDQNGN